MDIKFKTAPGNGGSMGDFVFDVGLSVSESLRWLWRRRWRWFLRRRRGLQWSWWRRQQLHRRADESAELSGRSYHQLTWTNLLLSL